MTRASIVQNRFAVILFFAGVAAAQDPSASGPAYRAERTSDHGIEVVRLTDVANGVEVAIVPSVGNTAYEMKVHGKNILYFPYDHVGQFRERPQLSGIPFLAPWANRLDRQAFFANGKKYNFDMELGNVRGEIPLHGLLTSSPYWEIISVTSNSRGARYTARLEFWRYPELMAQWPIAHEYEMTYALSGGELEVRIVVVNRSVQPMPIAVGFHPYYQIPGVPRDQWMAHIPARMRVNADPRLLPTGEYRDMDLYEKGATEFPLAGHTLDDGFIDLERDDRGRARFYIKSGTATVETTFGVKYPAAVVWEPNDQNNQPRPFICFEPMTGITNAINLAQDGKYPGLQMVDPGERWAESFWIRADGI